jgi:DNA-binding PadR family transcriptional regulator
MSSNDLSLFSYEILGLVGRQGAGAHDLLRMARRGRMFTWAGESQYYTEPKRLARLGYLDARREPGKTRERTVYTLTEQGLEALREWAQTPVRFTPLKSEMLQRMLICDLVGEEVTREGIATLRLDIDDLFAVLDDAERTAGELPHREKYLMLTIGFMRRLFQLHLDWLDEAERELAPES